jgi:hypothetical protein
MPNTTTATPQDRPLPRSYISLEKKKPNLPQNVIYARESCAAMDAGDKEAAWAWMAMAELPESAKFAFVCTFGEEFLKSKGFKL